MGYSFSSKLESSVFLILKWHEERGIIKNLKCQQRVYFFKNPDIYYIPDFSYELPSGEVQYAESKGYKTPEWNLKRKLWIHTKTEKLIIIDGSHAKPRLSEVINGDEKDLVFDLRMVER